MVVTEDEEVVYHKLPGGKRKRTTVVHDLMAAVNSGKRPAKKHLVMIKILILTAQLLMRDENF